MYYSLTQKSAWDVFCPGGKKTKDAQYIGDIIKYTGHFFVVFVNINVGLLVYIYIKLKQLNFIKLNIWYIWTFDTEKRMKKIICYCLLN